MLSVTRRGSEKGLGLGKGMGRMWAGGLMALVAGRAAAQPAALDRVPEGAAIVVATPNLGQLVDRISKYGNEVLKLEQAAQQLFMLNVFTNMPGLRRDGSVAMVVYPPKAGEHGEEGGHGQAGHEEGGHGDAADHKSAEGAADGAAGGKEMEGDEAGEHEEDMDDEGPGADRRFVAVIPVSDYAGLVKGMGGNPDEAVTELKGMKGEQPLWVKKLDDQYAAASPRRDLVEKFDGKAGRMGAHKTALGANGMRVAQGADVLTMVNVAAFTEDMKKGLAEGKTKATEEGPAAAAAFAEVEKIATAYFRDTTSNVLGLTLADAGMMIDSAAQFRAGSEIGGFFAASGNAGEKILTLPNQAFLFAGSFDTSAPGIKQIVKNLPPLLDKVIAATEEAAAKGEMQAQQVAAQLQGARKTLAQYVGQIEKLNGVDAQMGFNPSMLAGAGLFAGTLAHTRTSDPAGYMAFTKQAIEQANGQEQGGMKMTTTYTAGAAEAAGLKLDGWTSKPEMPPGGGDPFAQIAMGFVMGAGGQFAGYNAALPDGVLMTMSQNTMLVQQAVDAFNGKNNLSANAKMVEAQKQLPAGRTFEVAVGAQAILDVASTFAQMFVGMPLAVDPNAQLTPVLVGGTTNENGVHIRTFVPVDVITTYANVVKNLQRAGRPVEAEEGGQENNEEAPKF